MQSSKNH